MTIIVPEGELLVRSQSMLEQFGNTIAHCAVHHDETVI